MVNYHSTPNSIQNSPSSPLSNLVGGSHVGQPGRPRAGERRRDRGSAQVGGSEQAGERATYQMFSNFSIQNKVKITKFT